MNWTQTELAVCRAAQGWGLLLVFLGLPIRIKDIMFSSSFSLFTLIFTFLLPFFLSFFSCSFVPSFCHLKGVLM